MAITDPSRSDVRATGETCLSVIRHAPDPGVPARPETFLLVHGLASNARLWDGVAAELARRGHASVAVDQRGHGRSDKPDGGYDFATLTADLLALMDQLDLVRPVVVGQSWGGNIVLELAARHPREVRGIAAVDGGTIELSREFPTWEACLAALSPPRLVGTPRDQVEAWIRAAHPDWPEAGIAGAMANFEVRPDGTVAPWLTRERHLAILRELWSHRPSERYASVRVPVLLVPAEGAHDAPDRAAARRRSVEAALAALPDGRARWFRPADHDVHAQHPAELAAVLADAFRDGSVAP